MQQNEIIGIEFDFPSEYDTHLDSVFRSIALQDYSWYVTDCEILFYNRDIQIPDVGILSQRLYDGDEFAEAIASQPYNVIHARILAVPAGKSIDPNDIVDYNAFLNSECRIALLCADCTVSFYAKDAQLLNSVADVCTRVFEYDPDYLTVENDPRTGFFV